MNISVNVACAFHVEYFNGAAERDGQMCIMNEAATLELTPFREQSLRFTKTNLHRGSFVCNRIEASCSQKESEIHQC